MLRNILFALSIILSIASVPKLGFSIDVTPQSKASFKEVSWQDCLRQAALNHPDLISAKENIRQYKDASKITASALWPVANTDLSITGEKTNSFSSLGGTHKTVYTYGVSGSQLLFDGFKTINTVKSAQAFVNASQWNFAYVSSQVRLRLRAAFINLLKAQELIKLTRDIYQLRQESLNLIAKYYQAGIENSGSLMTAQANVAEAQFEINQAGRGLITAQINLIKEIGAKDFYPVLAHEDLDQLNSSSTLPDFNQILLSNPQLLNLKAKLNAAAFDLKASKGNFFPSVSLTGGVDKSDKVWPPKADSTAVGLSVAWPLFEGGSRLAQLDESKSKYVDLQAQVQSLNDALLLTLHQAWATWQDDIEFVHVQKKFLDADQERSRIAQMQYASGLLAYNEWTIIEDNLVTAKKNYLNAEINALLAEANWIQAQGRTLEYDK